MITAEITNAIAHIEKHRQAMAKEANATAACNEALRKLHEILDREYEALHLPGASDEHAAIVETIKAEIERVKLLTGAPGKGVKPKHGQPPSQKHVGPSQPHYHARNKGRRTMGRSSGR